MKESSSSSNNGEYEEGEGLGMARGNHTHTHRERDWDTEKDWEREREEGRKLVEFSLDVFASNIQEAIQDARWVEKIITWQNCKRASIPVYTNYKLIPAL